MIPQPAVNAAFGRGPQDLAHPQIVFYYDIACPYVYLAVPQLLALADRAGAVIDWRPVSLEELLRGAAEVPPILGGVVQDPLPRPLSDRQAMARTDVLRLADRLGLPPPKLRDTADGSTCAQRLLCWAPPVVRSALSRAFLSAYHLEGQDLDDPEVVLALATGVGLDERSARAAVLEGGLRAELTLERATRDAARLGVFGVPSFLVDTTSGTRLFFGQDRLPFVEEALRHHPLAAASSSPAQAAAPPPTGLALPDVPANEGRRVTFYYDFSSPFSYLASTQIEAIAARHGAVIDWHPILLGGLFRAIGTPLVPISTYGESKRRHAREDLARFAHRYGQPFHWPSRFPMVTVTALRLALLAGERRAALTHELFRAYWVEDGDLNDSAVLETALRRAGLPETLLAQVTAPEVKQQLLANNEAALAAGVFGAPSFLIQRHHGPPQLFFGQDRLDLVEQALHRGDAG